MQTIQEPLKLNRKETTPLKNSLKDINKPREVQTAGQHPVTCTQ